MNLTMKIVECVDEFTDINTFNLPMIRREINSILPRLRYVEKDGLPDFNGHVISIHKRMDGSLFVNNYNTNHLLTLLEYGFAASKLFAWLPESEFLEAFVGGGE